MDIKDVENLALLARIDLNQQEKEEILNDMKGILDYMKIINSIPMGEVEAKYDVYNVWREDEETERSFSKDIIKQQFPSSKGDFLKVKKIL